MQDLRSKATDKTFLRSLVANEYVLPLEIDSFQFVQALLPNLGSPDSELRDDLTYMIIANMLDQQQLKAAQVETLLLEILGPNYLFYRIGETGTNAVFMRSFSNLIIAAALYVDARAAKSLLTPGLVQNIKVALLRYGHEERDWRGYVEGKGWAHALAHLADALDECAQSKHLKAKDRQELMKLASELALLPAPLYHNEDMRLANMAYHIIAGKQVDDDFIETWLESCYLEDKGKQSVATWTSATNARNFLRSLYFLLLWDHMAFSVVDRIADLLRRWDGRYVLSEKGEG